eukprot:14021625-Alexandrium_andersonii.AAC.1
MANPMKTKFLGLRVGPPWHLRGPGPGVPVLGSRCRSTSAISCCFGCVIAPSTRCEASEVLFRITAQCVRLNSHARAFLLARAGCFPLFSSGHLRGRIQSVIHEYRIEPQGTERSGWFSHAG